jgi:dolichyl-phosphate beta-glucosyltransferase
MHMSASSPPTHKTSTLPPRSIDQWLETQQATQALVDISVVVPAYNEERRLPPTLLDLVDYFDQQSLAYEIIVVDDGSNDSTSQVVRKFERVREQVKLIQLPKNYGKGHAVRLGALNTHGKVILFADADGATPVVEFERLYTAIQNGAEIAIGSRALYSNDTRVSTSFHRKVFGRIFNTFVNSLLLPELKDTQCGFKMFSRSAGLFLFKQQRSDRFSFDVELLYIARKAHIAIKEIPVNWTNIPGSKVNLLIDSIKMFRDLFRFKVWHRSVAHSDYSRFKSALAGNSSKNT